MNAKKILIIGVVAAAVASFFIFDFGDYLSFSYLKEQQSSFNEYYLQHKWETIGIFFAVYVISVALSFPGATVLTLAGGAIFGVLTGTVIVSLASTLGGTLACVASRHVFRDYIQKRFGANLKRINEGVDRDGAFYLFTLRLIPVVPFFVINMVFGLTKMRLLTFFWVSQVGMLAGTAVYVNAGTQLSLIESPKEILSPGLIASLVLLGIFPLIAKRLVGFIRQGKYMKRYKDKKPSKFDYNVIVIGAGAGGLVSAYIAAAVKAKVALIERDKMGGDCLNTGCVPSKAIIKVAKVLHDAKQVKEYGFNRADIDFDFSTVIDRVQRVISKIEPHDSIERYSDLGVDCITGEARILDNWHVQVGVTKFSTRNIIIATGAQPLIPPIPGIKDVAPLTSNTLWKMRKLPKRFVVVGGGPIGSEMTQAFQRLGSEVTQIEADSRIMNKEDPDVSGFIQKRFEKEGICVLTGHMVKSFESQGDTKIVVCEKENGVQVRVECDEILMALGRRANVKGFGLEDLEIKLNKNGTIEVDEFLRTNYPNIFAVGDVAGPYQFTHFAAHQAWYASVNALFSPFKKFKADYRVIPWCTFTDPEVAHVGISEEEAKTEGIDYEVTKYGIDDLDRAITDGEAQGFVKVITPLGKDRILGVTIVGPHAGEYLGEFVIAFKYGLGLNKILGTIHSYPTLAEANKYTAGVWKFNHKPDWLLKKVAAFHKWRRG